MLWNFLTTNVPESLADLTEILLKNRKILDQELFFNPPDPLTISVEELGLDIDALQQAKERVLFAIKNKQKILVFGDYDADGVSATAIMWQSLYELGAEVLPFIPHREKHGYGLTDKALAELDQQPLPALLITVDTGIVAHQAIAELQSRGVDVIVTDHHQPDEVLPAALAVVHSIKICGAAVAWAFIRELSEDLAKKNLDLVALATVTDLMSLKGVNRALVVAGLKAINHEPRLGLKTLIEVAGLTNQQITSIHLGYVLGPRINAMGRLSSATDALRLICTNSANRANQLAQIVNNTNFDRQQLTADLYQFAQDQAELQHAEKIIVVHSGDFHEGIIGLIAGKLTERYAKPAIVISTRGKTAKASARSVPGVNITEIIRTAHELLLEFGGHPMAAGFGFEQDKLTAVVDYLLNYGRENISSDLLQKSLEIDCLLPVALVDLKAIDLIAKFAPFGQGNHLPLFALADMRVTEIKVLGRQAEHLKLTLTSAGNQQSVVALFWGKAELKESLTVGSLVDVVGVLDVNEWQGVKTPQLIGKDLKLK